jgi:hypothetical protein
MEVHSPLSSFVPLRALPRAPSNLFDFCAFVFEKIPPDYAIVLSVEENSQIRRWIAPSRACDE